MRPLITSILVMLTIAAALPCMGQWKPAEGPLATRWTKEVSPDNALPEYPRPQMVRKDWLNLNGLWEYAIVPRGEERPEQFDGQILVPFAAESALSGVKKTVGEANRIWYRRTFEVPQGWSGRRLLLHFGGVDWDSTIWLNGEQVGTHRGGYDPFVLDVSDALKPSGPQEIVLAVWDPTDAGYQPRGKQVRDPRGIWYTSVTGIWRTVWLEPVAEASIRSLKIVPDVDGGTVTISADARTLPGETSVKISVLDGAAPVVDGSVDIESDEKQGEINATAKLKIADAKLWSPDSPFLYDLKVVLLHDGKVVDEVASYFGMRKIALGKDPGGVLRLFLNNKPLFQYGPLDQGWWPDGLYTAPTDEALRYDVEVTKNIGMNMIRKHVKVEPARWYYHCDKLGMMVWQDLPNGDRHIGRNAAGIERSEESAENFHRELKAMIDTHHNHPSIVTWVPFNEGWGQFDTKRVTDWVKSYDPTRLVNSASGWTDRGTGDVNDVHRYPGPGTAPLEENRAIVLGEFGGLGLPVEGHLWWDKRNWGYRNFKNADELTAAYRNLLGNLKPLIGQGLAAAIYTQTSDVEGEVNGLMTYDRAMVKMGVETLRKLNEKLYLPPPVIKTIVPASRVKGQTWQYTFDKPADGWQQPEFDDSAWKSGPGGFGTKDTPGTVIRTNWASEDIWIRREFTLDAAVADPHLLLHHDEDAEVYINGVPAAKLTGFVTSYVLVSMNEGAAGALKVGRNTIAIHCRQTVGGQHIDAGIVSVVE